MEILQLQKRETTGKNNKRIVKQGFVAAVVYNEKTESFNVQLDAKLAQKMLRESSTTTILDADYEGKKLKLVIKDVDFDPQTDKVRHIAFFQIDETKPMLFTVPFTLVGIAPAVKNNLGVLVKTLPALEVKCKLSDLKSTIEIDISKMDHAGQTISVSDINLPEGMVLAHESQSHSAIVTITQLQKAEEAVATTTEEAAATTEAAPAEEAK